MTQQAHSPRQRRLRAGVDIALVAVLTIALLAWFFDPLRLEWHFFRLRVSWGVKPILAVFLILTCRLWVNRVSNQPLSSPTENGILPRIALSIGSILICLALTESALKMMGVPPGEAVFVVRGKSGPAIRADGSMVSDADLLWRFQPGSVFNGRTVNQLGFLDREVCVAKPDGVRRVVCMGDSCSGQGVPPYSGHVHAQLQSHTNTAGSWEAFNTAVHGYTVLQGLALYRKRVAALEPDIVTIFYGWNDHWLATEPDAVRLARSGSALGTAIRNALAKKRLAVAMRKIRGADADARKVLRVPPDEYAGALTRLIQEIQADGAIPVVLTAPRARTISRRIVHGGHTRSVEEAIALHDSYADITRQVARETGARLFDLATLFTEPTHFSDDGIHYTDEGIRHLAQLVHGEIVDVIQTATP